jgi:PAS domain S-box-containing protein
MSSETVPESFFIHSDLEVVYANPAFCTFFGVKSRGELSGTSLTDIVTAEYCSPLQEQVLRIENDDELTLGLTIEFQTFTAQPQRAILLSSLVKWDDSEYIRTSVFPITGAGDGSRQPTHGQAMNDAPMGITITDPSRADNPMIYANDGFCELTGYSRDEILGRNCRFLQGEATSEESVAQIRGAIDAEEPVTVELQNYKKDGSMFWNRVTLIPTRSNSNAVATWLGYQQEVTAEKQYEQDLSLFREQADEADRAILITDSEGIIEYINPAFTQLTGYTASETIGRTPNLFEPTEQDNEFDTGLWEQVTVGEIWEGKVANQTKYGEIFDVKRKIVPVTDEKGDITHFVWIDKDITEKILTTQTLDVLNRVLRHNLRNALTMIDGYAELLENEDIDPKTRQASVAVIREQAASMQKIAEKTAEVRSIWDPAETHGTWERLKIEPLVAGYQRQYPDVDINYFCEDNGEIQVRHAELFKKAIDEAVTNAIKHTDQSSPEVRISLQRNLDAKQLQISTADNGAGIPMSEWKIVQSGKESPLSHCLGVGIWFMEWIMTALGGTLTISDNKPRGSVVTFQLPVGDSSNK